ncbi:hypothetical protein ACJRO7_017044 [Eucalyptus globulus]|uniref:La-related protein 6A n=1 Tax=Eucalyptus globulus TaxID=34317 RepID=A0ABD3KQW9_EUCGL
MASEGEAEPAAAATAAAGDGEEVELLLPPPPPPLPDPASVGSPEEKASGDLSPSSDDDANPDHGNDEGLAQAAAAVAAAVLADDLKQKIVRQVEYYFSDENLPTDNYMMGWIKKNKQGFVPIGVIASFRKMKKLTQDHSVVATALKESTFLVVSPDEKKVKRLHPFPSTEALDPKLCTVLVENLPEDHSVENLERIFSEVGKVKSVSVHNPSAVEEPKKHGKPEKLHSTKLHALIEYETVEAAEKAVAALNNEEDWRNGMHVKILKRMGKQGQRKINWRVTVSERNGSAHLFNQVGVEEDHKLSEHHDSVPDEEDGDRIPKDKNGDRSRNYGRPKRYNHRGMNGHGHGTTTSTHIVEPSKPPSGPRMPDGTRGFTMGRGRPLVPDLS